MAHHPNTNGYEIGFTPLWGRVYRAPTASIAVRRPRMQSRAGVVPLKKGNAVAFAVHNRPVRGTNGSYRVNLRHASRT